MARSKQTAKKRADSNLVSSAATSSQSSNNTRQLGRSSKSLHRPSQEARQQIRQYKRSPGVPGSACVLYRQLVVCLCRELAADFRFQSDAVMLLEAAARAFVQSFVDEARVCAEVSQRWSLTVRDLRLAMRIRGAV